MRTEKIIIGTFALTARSTVEAKRLAFTPSVCAAYATFPRTQSFDNGLKASRSMALLNHKGDSDFDERRPADIDHFRKWFGLYSPGLEVGASNHIPMVTSAMCALGASHKEVVDFIRK